MRYVRGWTEKDSEASLLGLGNGQFKVQGSSALCAPRSEPRGEPNAFSAPCPGRTGGSIATAIDHQFKEPDEGWHSRIM